MKRLYRPNRASRQAVCRKGKGKRRLVRLLLAVGLPLLLLTVAGLAGFAGGTLGSPWLRERVHGIPAFRLDTLTVKGNGLLSEAEVAERAGVAAGESVLTVDLHEVRERLLDHPLVRKASVSRRLPSTLIVEIEERMPAAVVRGERETVVDRDGYVVNVPPGDAPEILPCFAGVDIENGRVTEGGLRDLADGLDIVRAMRAADFPPAGEVGCVDLSRSTDAMLLPSGDGPLVHLGRGDTPERLERWKAVRNDMAANWESFEYIDLRAEGQVVAKPRALSEGEEPGGEDG